MVRPVSIKCPECGEPRLVAYHNAKRRKSDLCKTCMLILRNKANATHGLERHPLYNTWANIKRRIDNPHVSRGDHSYAGLGLDMDPAWRDVTTFIAWAIKAGWEPGLSIERKNNAKGYWPRNCTFIPVLHQARNRRNNSMTQKLADEINRRVARGEVRYHVAKDVHARTGIPLSTCNKVAYGVNWQ